MKKQVLLFFLFISTLSFAQVRVGALVGGDLTTFKVTDADADFPPMKSIFTYHGGVMFSIPIVADFSIQPGLLYRLKGSQFSKHTGGTDKGISFDVDFSGELKFQYIELPLNLAYSLDLNKKLKITPYAGFYAAHIISAKSTIERTIKAMGISKTETIHKDFIEDKDVENWDFGSQIGIGVEVNKLFFRLQYSLGLTNTSRPDKDDKKEDKSKAYNRGFGLSIGYWINK